VRLAVLLLLPLLASVPHTHTSVREWLSTALWAGLALVLTALAVAGLLIGSRLLARRGAKLRRPCPECGNFYDQSGEGVCPQCGYAPGPSDAEEPR
jgi:hypothetical protein